MKHYLLFIYALIIALSLNAQVPTIGLIAYWPFSGTTADMSGYNYHGSLVGNPTLTMDRFGNPNSAYHFDGVDDYIIVNNDNPVITTTEFTISGWAKLHGESGGYNKQATIFEQRDDNANASTAKSTIMFIIDYYGNNPGFFIRSSISNGSSCVASCPIPDYMEWKHYVALIGTDDTMRVYINANQISKTYFSQAGNFNTSIDHVDIGSHRHTGNSLRGALYGDIDDVRIYNRALSEREILDLFLENTENNITKHENDLDVNIYPNPATDYLIIEFGKNYQNKNYENYLLSIHNTLGQIVYSTVLDFPITKIQLNSLNDQNLYFIQIIDKQKNIIVRKKLNIF